MQDIQVLLSSLEPNAGNCAEIILGVVRVAVLNTIRVCAHNHTNAHIHMHAPAHTYTHTLHIPPQEAQQNKRTLCCTQLIRKASSLFWNGSDGTKRPWLVHPITIVGICAHSMHTKCAHAHIRTYTCVHAGES